MKKVSIIIPVYNVERYLERCIDSVLNQSYTNFEIILVNDGSTDNSLKICKDYEDKDDRIKLIDKKNGGLSSARNAGLDSADGEFIVFIDSDDYIDSRLLEVQIGNIEKFNADVAQMQWTTFSDNVDFTFTNKCKKYDKNIESFLLKNNNLYCVVRYLFSKKCIGDMRFDESLKLAEDQEFNFKVLRNVKSIVASNYKGYFYYQNVASLSHGVVKENHYIDLQVRKNIYNTVNNKKSKKLAKAHLMKAYIAILFKALKYGHNCEEDIIEKYAKFIKKHYFYYLFNRSIDIKRKIAATCILFGKNVAKKIAKVVA